MPFTVVYDADALYGNATRDLLIRIAQAGIVQAKWTDRILDEMLGNLGEQRPNIAAERLSRLRELMNAAVRDCLVTGYEPLMEGLKLPDPGDQHVLAAAIKSGADIADGGRVSVDEFQVGKSSPAGPARPAPSQRHRQARAACSAPSSAAA